jgi:hypothetical protein
MIRFFLYSLKENSRSTFFLLIIKTIKISFEFLSSAKYILLRDFLDYSCPRQTSSYFLRVIKIRVIKIFRLNYCFSREFSFKEYYNTYSYNIVSR